MGREKLIQGSQAVAQFVVVTKAPFHIAKSCHGAVAVVAQLVGCLLTLETPLAVLAIDPEVHDVDGRSVLHAVYFKEKRGVCERQEKAPSYERGLMRGWLVPER